MAEKTAKQPENVEEKTAKQTQSEVSKYDPKSLNLKPGLTVRVHQMIKETNAKGELKERVQIFEGRIIAMKHGLEPGATITVRKISEGIGVEKIFPLFSPNIEKIEIKKEAKVRRAKLYFLREYKKRLTEKLLG
ncbi:MAG: 50S ribosomal protein L19 [Candidatus Komeilibacteria bacterium]